jgi:hypothetical protein
MDAFTIAVEVLKIQALKAKYFRAIDTKSWAELREVFTDDLVFWRDASFAERSEEPVTTDAASFVASIRERHETSVTVHHGHNPEIELLEPTVARGIWALHDWVDNESSGHAWQGYGHYLDDYVRLPDGGWRIKRMRLSRVRITPTTTTPPGDIAAVRTAWQQGVLPAADQPPPGNPKP